ncbi:MAG TPA: FAD-binding oxidoreductase [Myxococcaceae bacterium]|nr:FAD-binding oxidoreductase [Myxococcaceae bacterium]
MNETTPREAADAPASEGEIVSLLQRRRERGVPGPSVTEISRRRLDALVRLDPISGVVEVGAGMKLDRLEQELRLRDLSLGPLSPGMAGLEVARFLEGPYAGLRAVRGGRLEPCTIALTAIMADGLRYTSRPSPRKAAGPDLDALFLGGEGRFGLIVSATLRLVARPRTEREVAFSFPSMDRALSALRAAVASGARLRSATLRGRAGRFTASAEVIGSPDAVEIDLSTLGQESLSRGGRSSSYEPARASPPPPPPGDERELSWEEVAEAVASGAEVRCWRLALESVVAAGVGERGRSLARGGDWANAEILAAALAVADPAGILGELP